MLQQIINNAGTNAIKFSPIGSRVTISSNLTGDATAVIRVSDTGLGMGAAELDRIKSKNSMSGLGYCVMHHLSERSGVNLVVNSQRGKGTVVEIRLDIATSEN